MRSAIFGLGLLAAGLLATPTATAQTTTKVKANEKEATVKQKTEDGQKTKIKTEKGDKSKAGSMNGSGSMSGSTGSSMSASGNNIAGGAASGAGVMVGGAMMLPSRDIVDNAALSQDHTTLVTAVKSAGLVETLKGTGPFTVFAPTNAAFNKLPAGTVDKLVMPESKAQLTDVLTYHVVPGRYTAADLKDGQTLTTVEGKTLTVMKTGNQVMVRDGKGMTATVTTPDVVSSNGVTHVIDTVLMPGM